MNKVKQGSSGKPVINLMNEENVLVIFIPKGDDSFASTSHTLIALVQTPEGDWLFNKRNE